MRKAFLPVLLVSLALTPSGAPADDWPQWRGCLRNGVAPNSPALVNAFGEDGPKRLWLSEPLMGEDAERFGTGRMSSPGGEGSVSVAAGRGYVCVNINVDVPMTERKIDTKRFGGLERRAWNPKVPKAYVDAVEAARLSEARRKLQSETEIRNWTNRWMKENEKPEYRKYRAFASTRLKDGPEALPFDVMKKLLTIRKRMFASQAELDKWFDDNGIDQPSRKYLTERKHIQTVARKGRDLLYCLDADTGKRIWKAEMPGSWMHYVCAFTPAVSAGRCYMLTSEAVVWCFDAKDGKKIWKSKVLVLC